MPDAAPTAPQTLFYGAFCAAAPETGGESGQGQGGASRRDRAAGGLKAVRVWQECASSGRASSGWRTDAGRKGLRTEAAQATVKRAADRKGLAKRTERRGQRERTDCRGRVAS